MKIPVVIFYKQILTHVTFFKEMFGFHTLSMYEYYSASHCRPWAFNELLLLRQLHHPFNHLFRLAHDFA
jgi:hypothetical protein